MDEIIKEALKEGGGDLDKAIQYLAGRCLGLEETLEKIGCWGFLRVLSLGRSKGTTDV